MSIIDTAKPENIALAAEYIQTIVEDAGADAAMDIDEMYEPSEDDATEILALVRSAKVTVSWDVSA